MRIIRCFSAYIANVHRLASLPVGITRADKRKKGLQLHIYNLDYFGLPRPIDAI